MLAQKQLGFQYHIPRPGLYESVGGVLEFSASGDVQSLKCEYFGRAGVDGDVTISINSDAPYSVMTTPELNTSEPLDCLPFSSTGYDGASYIPCVLEPEFNLIVSHGPALEVVEQVEGGAQVSSEDYAIVVTKNSSAYYVSASDLGEKRNISSLCSNSEENGDPLYVNADQRLLYEFALEPYGQTNYLVCFKNEQRMKSMSWSGRGYDYADSRYRYQQKDESYKDKAKQERDSGGHQSGNKKDYGWRQSGSDQNGRQDQKAPATDLKVFVTSNIVYFLAFFGMGDFAYQIIDGGPVERAYFELGLPMHNADVKAIKRRCRSIKKRHYPDKGGNAEAFYRYTEICDALVDVVK